MPNEDIDLDKILSSMSSINSEDYWFTKVSNIEEHDEKADSAKSKDISENSKN